MGIDKVLVVDDEMLVRNFLAETLRRRHIDVTLAENGQKAISLLKETAFDLVITDMKMPDITGIDVLKKTKELSPATLVVVITAFGSIENAVEAMRLGALNYIIKPFSPDTIEAVIDKAKEHISLVQENQYLRQQVSGMPQSGFHIIGESPAMKKILEDVNRIAKSNANVFITGESGTGKEVIAHAIHYNSLRSSKPFIKVNCAAVPETLIESEFFGHEKGSFTGANAKRLGRFELANTGTLLLDEVTEIPLLLQAKLLRVIQEQEFERVGGTKPVKVDVRLVSTSNRNMKEAIEQKILREDLYYRLNVVPIYLPPLRERKEDILPLAEYFLQKMCRENHKENNKTLTPEAKQKLLAYPWPGNTRELANIIERAVVMDNGDKIAPEHLYIEGLPLAGNKPAIMTSEGPTITLPIGISLQELEKRLIVETLAMQQQNRTKTAETLGISIRTLRNKLHEYNIKLE
jgi:two-component system response regulator AtoC